MVAGKLPIQRTDHSVNRWVGFYSLADGAVMKHCTGLLTTRHQEKKSERRKVFISFLVVPTEYRLRSPPSALKFKEREDSV